MMVGRVVMVVMVVRVVMVVMVVRVVMVVMVGRVVMVVMVGRVVMVVNKIKFYKIIIVLGAINYEGSKKKFFFFSQSVDRKCQSDDSAESLTGLSKRPS